MVPSEQPPTMGDGRPSSSGPRAERTRGRRIRRALVWTLATLLLLAVVVVAGVFWTLGHLEQPTVKRWVRDALAKQTGLDVDYAALSVRLPSGEVHARGLAVRQPKRFAPYATDAVTLERLDAQVDLRELAAGTVRIGHARLEGLTLTVVADASSDTLSTLFPTDSTAPATPLSHSLDALDELGVDAGGLEIDPLRVRWLQVESGAVVRRAEAGPFALRGELHAATGKPTARLDLSPGSGHDTVDAALEVCDGPPSPAGAHAAWSTYRAHLTLDAKLSLDGPARLVLDAEATTDATLPLPRDLPLRIGLDAQARFDPAASRTELSIARLSLLGGVAKLDGAATIADATPARLDAVRANLALAWDRQPWPLAGVDTRGVDVSLALDDGTLSAAAARGHVALDAKVRKLDAAEGASWAAAEGLDLRFESTLAAERLEGAAAPADLEGAAKVSLGATSRDLEVATLRAESVGTGSVEATGLHLGARSPGAALIVGSKRGDPERALVVRSEQDAPLPVTMPLAARALAVTAGSDAVRAEGLSLDLDVGDALAVLDATRPLHAKVGGALDSARGRVAGKRFVAAVPALDATLSRDGDVYALAADTTVRDVAVDTHRFRGVRRLEVRGQGDASARHATLDLNLSGARGPTLDAHLKAHAPPGPSERPALVHSLHVRASRLGLLIDALAPSLPDGARVSLDRIELDASGTTHGVLGPPATEGGLPALDLDHLDRVAAKETLRVRLRGLGARLGGRRVEVSKLELTGDATKTRGEGLVADLVAKVPAAELAQGAQVVTLSGLDAKVRVSTPPGAHGRPPDRATLVANASVQAVGGATDTLLGGYPLRDTEVSAAAELMEGSVVLDRLRVVNPPGGTKLLLTGAYEDRSIGDLRAVAARSMGRAAIGETDAIPGRKALKLSGVLEQDLAPLTGTAFARRADGHVRAALLVESGNLESYQADARLVATDVDFEDPEGNIAVKGLSGLIPIHEVLTMSPEGLRVDAGEPYSPVARTRFADVQPFLSGDHYLRADSIRLLGEPFGPLAGNLRVAGLQVALDRMEVGYRGGVIAGQLHGNLDPSASRLSLRGTATGIRTPHSTDILDANLALDFVPKTLALDGTVHVVRIGRSHLRALLDLFDPYHADPDMNTVRKLLRFGYPRFAELRAHGGLVDLRVALGGLAGVVKIKPILAIPVAPLLEDYVAPLLEPLLPSDRVVPTGAGDDASSDETIEQTPATNVSSGASPPTADSSPDDVPAAPPRGDARREHER
ncbi:MAG: hypothetical protein KC543_06805 [Myxococcales bacterium]|nr:hypothetical protein [Myxococcales bacterium]